MNSIEELEKKLAEPSAALIEDLSKIQGDITILGAGGKMGPSLARLIQNGINESGISKKVYAVSRFSSGSLRSELEKDHVHTISADLLKDEELSALPETENVIYMAGFKFGATGNEGFTWAMNAYLPGRVCEKFKDSRIVSFSTGNVYPLTPVKMGGASEEHPVGPVGEYAQSCLGRERMFQYYSIKNNTPVLNLRLNYAVEMRYGVLLEVASAVYEQRPVDLSTGHVNVIWQGDANEAAVRSLQYCASPATTLNITGPETLSIRWLAERFGERFKKVPIFINEESDTALLSNSSRAHDWFGYPRVTLRQMMEWTAGWVENGGYVHGKATHFQQREGKF
jgi:nucleoside-diphosphate-sugar epimerase